MAALQTVQTVQTRQSINSQARALTARATQVDQEENWDEASDSEFGHDDEAVETAASTATATAKAALASPGSSGSSVESGGRVFAIADDGSRVRVPMPDVYPGEPPFAAPVLGFHAKAAEIFDTFAYLHTNSPRHERPDGFLPVIGLIGDDPAKDKDSGWKLHVRLRPEVWKELLEKSQGAIDEAGSRPGVVVSAMRSENLALFTISHPQQMFAQNVWMTTMPMAVMKTPLSTIDESQAHALVRAEKARAQVLAQTAKAARSNRSAQLSLDF